MRDELIQAIKTGNAEKVRQLLAIDRALASVRAETGESAILLAMYHGHRGIANLLWDYGASMNIWEAAAVGANDQIKALMKQDSALAGSLSFDGFTPLQLAAFFGNKEAVEFLVAQGSDVNAISRNATFARGVPVLQSAVASGEADVVRILLEHGANPNVLNDEEGTPLYAAAFEGNAEMVKLLLAHGADTQMKTKAGKRAIEIAKERGFQAVADLLATRDL